MNKEMSSRLKNGAILAFVFSMLLSYLWVVVTGETQRSPVVSEQFMQSMTSSERAQWFAENMKVVSFLEHASRSAEVLLDNPVTYAKSVVLIFVCVFTIQGAFILGGKS